MSKLPKLLFLCLMAALVASAQVNPTLLSLVPPDAKIISGVRVDSAKASAFGTYVLSQMQTADPGFQQFIQNTGFDPTRDLTEIVSAATGTSAQHSGLILGRGSFNAATITSAAQSAGATATTYKGIQLLTHPSKTADVTGAVAFLGPNLAVMGSVGAVQSAIDRYVATNSGTAVPALPKAVTDRIAALSGVNDAWVLTTGPITDFFAGKVSDPNLNGALQGNLLQAIQQASGGIKFNPDGVLISGEALARSEKDAEALRDVVKFLAGMVQLNKDSNAQTQKFATLLDALQVTAQNSTMTLSLSIPEATIEQLFVPRGARPRVRHVAGGNGSAH